MSQNCLFFLADDDTDDQDFFIDALKEIDKNIQCIVAGDGIEALEKLRSTGGKIPDFIFLDQNMPRMTGLQCLHEIKKIESLKNVPIVMCSTAHANKDYDEAKELGVKYFFKKTPSFRELVSYLKNLLGR